MVRINRMSGKKLRKDDMHHIIKIESAHMDAVIEGSKNFEIRENDRGYQKGDTVAMIELVNDTSKRQVITVVITYVTGFMQKENIVVFGFKKV